MLNCSVLKHSVGEISRFRLNDRSEKNPGSIKKKGFIPPPVTVYVGGPNPLKNAFV